MLNLEYTNQFKKDIKKITKQGLDSKRHCTAKVQCLLVCLFNFKRLHYSLIMMSIITSLVFSMPFLARVPTLARVSSTSLPTMPSPGW